MSIYLGVLHSIVSMTVNSERIQKIADELEINMMQRALDRVLPDGLELKHYPRNNNDPLKPFVDYMIKEKVGMRLVDRIALECKNWQVIPTPEQFVLYFLARFTNCPSYVQKIIIGHVNFREEQLSTLREKGISYIDIGYQILPEYDEDKKTEYLNELSTNIAQIILTQTGRFREDCVSRAKLQIIGEEIRIEFADGITRSIRLTDKKKIWKKLSGLNVFPFIKVGNRPLDLINWTKFSVADMTEYYLKVPKQYEVYSNNAKFKETRSISKDYIERYDPIHELRKLATSELYTEFSKEIHDVTNQCERADIVWQEEICKLKRFGHDTKQEGISNFFKTIHWESIV